MATPQADPSTAATKGTDFVNKAEQETGLSLLFAASILQQQRRTTDDASSVPPALALSSSSSGDEASTSMSTQSSSSSLLSSVSSAAPAKNRQDHQKEEASPSRASTGSVVAVPLPNGAILTPQTLDVLSGRGGMINKHSGNVVFRKVVEHNKQLYRRVPKRQRILVSQSIVRAILNQGGRFLMSSSQQGKAAAVPKQQQVVWLQIPFQRAVQKTSQALRERCGGSGGADSPPSTPTDSSTHFLAPPSPPSPTTRLHNFGDIDTLNNDMVKGLYNDSVAAAASTSAPSSS